MLVVQVLVFLHKLILIEPTGVKDPLFVINLLTFQNKTSKNARTKAKVSKGLNSCGKRTISALFIAD